MCFEPQFLITQDKSNEGGSEKKKRNRVNDISIYLLRELYDLSHLGIHRDSRLHAPWNAFIQPKKLSKLIIFIFILAAERKIELYKRLNNLLETNNFQETRAKTVHF